MTIPSVSGSRASALATTHTDPANVPLPSSAPASRRSSKSDGSALGLPKLAGHVKKSEPSTTRRGIGALPAEMHFAIAEHLPLTDIVTFAKTGRQINGGVTPLISDRKADYQALSGRIDTAQSLNDLHAIAGALHRDDVPFQKMCAQIGVKISRMLGTITTVGAPTALPEASRAAEVHRCLTTFAQMEPAAMRAAGLGRAIGMAKTVLPTHHQAVFDDGLAKMQACIPGSERAPVLNALIATTATSAYDGSGPASQQVANNIAHVLQHMDGLPLAAKQKLVAAAMNQTMELCEPGWSVAMDALNDAYKKLNPS